MVTMKLRHPYTTASIWSSGKITCTGANTEQEAKTAARKFSRILQKLGERSNIYLGGDGGGISQYWCRYSLSFLFLFSHAFSLFSSSFHIFSYNLVLRVECP
jgi:hypothetical protein